MNSNARPFDGLRILDLSQGVVGPVGGGIMTDMGAEVIKIEQPARAAAARSNQQAARRLSGQAQVPEAFNIHNRGKHHFPLDLSKPEGVELFKELVKISDVVFENFSPRVMTNFGLECPALQEINPRTIHVAMPAFGSTGPYRNLISQGPGVDAMTGLSEMTGYADSMPLKPGNYYADYMNGLLSSYCILTGLFARKQTGRGQHIEAPMREVQQHALGEALIDYELNGRIQTRQANRHMTMAPHNVYRCVGEDRWIAIAIETDDEWIKLVEAMGSPAWTREERFATAVSRYQHQTDMDELISGWTAEQDHVELARRLQELGVPAGTVQHPDQVFNDPQLAERGFFRPFPESNVLSVSLGFKYANTPLPIPGPAPEFGEHTDYVLRNLLNCSDARIELLKEKNVISYGLE